MASTSSYASVPSIHCAWGLCRLSFGTKDQLKEHIRRHVLEARPIPRPRPEGSEISESYLPPRIAQTASSPPPVGNTSGAETTTEESQSSVNRAPAYGLDELPAPVMSAPPASIHSQYTQSMSIQESQDAPSPPEADEPFGLHFSQMQDVQFTQV